MRVTRRLIVIGLDVLTAGLCMLSVAIARFGGFIVRFPGLRISLGTAGRALFALGAVVIVRLILGPRISPFGMSPVQRQRLRSAIGADPFLVRAPAGLWRRAALA